EGGESVPRIDRVLQSIGCGGVIEPLDARAEGGTRGEVVPECACGVFGFGPAARHAPGLIEHRVGGFMESARHVFQWLDLACDIPPPGPEPTDLRARADMHPLA